MKSIKFFAVVLVFAAVPVFGQSADAPLDVTANVVANCTITTLPVDFGDYDPLAAGNDDDGVGTITIRCTRGAGVSIDLDLGLNAVGGLRHMTDGTDNLNYELYTDAPGGTVWNSLAIAASANFAARNFSVFGRIPAGQDVGVGVYNDTVQATINY